MRTYNEYDQYNHEADVLERAKESGMTFEDAIDLITDYMVSIDQMALDIQAYLKPRVNAY